MKLHEKEDVPIFLSHQEENRDLCNICISFEFFRFLQGQPCGLHFRLCDWCRLPWVAGKENLSPIMLNSSSAKMYREKNVKYQFQRVIINLCEQWKMFLPFWKSCQNTLLQSELRITRSPSHIFTLERWCLSLCLTESSKNHPYTFQVWNTNHLKEL